MADKSIDSPVTPENMELESGHKKRNSTGKIDILNHRGKILSRYLRGSAGSCHDLCKYGIKHDSEASPRSPMQKTVAARGGKGRDLEKTVTSIEGKKKPISSNPSPNTEIGKLSHLVVFKEVASSSTNVETVSSEDILPPFAEIDAGLEIDTCNQKVSLIQLKQSSHPKKGEMGEGKKLLHSSSAPRKSESRSKQLKTCIMVEKKILTPPTISLFPKHCVKKSSTISANTDKNLERLSYLNYQKNVKEAKTEQASNEDFPERTLHVIEYSTENDSVVSTPTSVTTNLHLSSSSTSIGRSLKHDHKGEKKILVPPTISLSPKHSVMKSKESNANTNKNLRGVSCLKNQKNVKDIKLEHASNEDLPEKTLHIIESKAENESARSNSTGVTTNLPLSSSLSSEGRRLKNARKEILKSGLPPSSRKRFRRAGNGTHRMIPDSSSHPFPGKINWRHIQSVWSSSSSPSSMSPSHSSLRKQNGFASAHDKTENGCQGEKVKLGYKIRPKTSALVRSGNEVVPARKLNFRRGKVIELQPQNSAAWRLKFRRAVLLRDIQNSKDDSQKRKIVRWSDVGDNALHGPKPKSEKVAPRHQIVEGSRRSVWRKKVDGSKSNATKPESEQVVLRHQNVERREVIQRLYNNVIEETASKLADTRKSKVKALVGAFETVISLQDARPMEISK
ncbi:Plant calmodulin-binding-like protein [Quillaja saponaria]|uniref:Plant calmodulin-binding-like protein n=1 Tax=Quillaja saponaria TaxID=32244 RepID=A0AAD7LEM5_QUISA|nr:Plant calmodulin-binding-like protein [Quillaja saponaria]